MFRNLLRACFATAHRPARRRPLGPTARPCLEGLEDRLVPTVAVVDPIMIEPPVLWLTTEPPLVVLPPGPLTYTAPSGSGAVNLLLRLDGGTLELLANNTLLRTASLARTTGVVITGADNQPDTLTIDNDFGGPISVRDGIRFDGGAGGGNALTILDTAGADSVTLTPTSATFNGVEAVAFANVQSVTARGGNGDNATLYAGPGGATFLATPDGATLSGPGFNFTANGFSSVTAVAGSTGDQAYLFGGPGDDTFSSSPAAATLSGSRYGPGVAMPLIAGSGIPGSTYSNQASGFAFVSAFAGSGGTDKAYLADSTGDDLFIGTPTYSYLQAGASLVIASGFGWVGANSSGGYDLALLFDSGGDDVFAGRPTYSYLAGANFVNQATGFAQVRGIASTGNDVAYLFDGPGDNLFRVTPAYSFLAGTGYLNLVMGFAQVSANLSAGDNDVADIYVPPVSAPVPVPPAPDPGDNRVTNPPGDYHVVVASVPQHPPGQNGFGDGDFVFRANAQQSGLLQ
jgi:hypothetical protein